MMSDSAGPAGPNLLLDTPRDRDPLTNVQAIFLAIFIAVNRESPTSNTQHISEPLLFAQVCSSTGPRPIPHAPNAIRQSFGPQDLKAF